MDLVNINNNLEGESDSVPYQDRVINSPSLNSSPTISNAISILQSQQELNCDDLVNPPFPPNVDPEALANRLFRKQRKSKKMLNEFFIFRGEFVQELKRLNVRPKQTKVSALASTSWHSQKSHVKDEYRRLARETEKVFMVLKQREREADESCRTESSQSSPKDLTPPSTSPVPDQDNFILPPPQTFQQMPQNFTPILNHNDYYVKSSYRYIPSQNLILPGNITSTPDAPYMVYDYYNNYNNAIIPSQSAQAADIFINYSQ